jgi:hypothetical protein
VAVTTADKKHKTLAEYLTDQLMLSASRNELFKVVERDLKAVTQKIKLRLSRAGWGWDRRRRGSSLPTRWGRLRFVARGAPSQRAGQGSHDRDESCKRRGGCRPAPPMTPFGLEPFIPADASLAVGLSGSAAMQQLFATQGVDTREKLTALATCKIDFTNARVLIASRGAGSHLIVVRAPGIAEDRNLYCLAGVMGEGRVQVASEGPGYWGARCDVVNRIGYIGHSASRWRHGTMALETPSRLEPRRFCYAPGTISARPANLHCVPKRVVGLRTTGPSAVGLHEHQPHDG